jgi:hypothetical protein
MRFFWTTLYIEKDIPVGGSSLGLPRSGLRLENGFFWGAFSCVTILKDGSKNYETKMAAVRRDSAVTVGVVGAPSRGIELVLKQISLLVAQIRVICKNGPQVSIDNIK